MAAIWKFKSLERRQDVEILSGSRFFDKLKFRLTQTVLDTYFVISPLQLVGITMYVPCLPAASLPYNLEPVTHTLLYAPAAIITTTSMTTSVFTL